MLNLEGHSTPKSVHVSMSPSASRLSRHGLSIAYLWGSYIQYQLLHLGSISLLGACRFPYSHSTPCC